MWRSEVQKKMTTAEKANIMEKKSKEQDLVTHARLSLLLSNVGMRTLRLLFRERYKALNNKEFENGSIIIPLSKECLKKHDGSYNDHTREEQKALSTTDINKVDFELLLHILSMDMESVDLSGAPTDLIMRSRPLKRREFALQTESAKIEALKVLGNIRNCLVEHPPGQHKDKTGYFSEMWVTAVDALLCLGAHKSDIDCIRTCTILNAQDLTAAINSENGKKSQGLLAAAALLTLTGQYDRAMQLYDEALLLSGLSPSEKSCLHSIRCEAFFLSKRGDQRNSPVSDDNVAAAQSRMTAAMNDARSVIQLEPESCLGYFFEGKLFKLCKFFNEAIDSLEVAQTLNPTPEEIAIDSSLFECRLDKSDIESQLTADPKFIPTRLSEIIESREEIQQLVKNHEEMMSSRNPAESSKGFLFMGYRHQLGDEAPLDPKRASELFWNASRDGSPEGAYRFGRGVLTGTWGQNRCLTLAVSYFERAAKYLLRAGSDNIFQNDAIVRSKAALGMFYQHGVGVSRNYGDAAIWHARAAGEGSGIAAANLARMLFVGMGMAQDMKMSLQYQKFAVELGIGGAAGMYFLGSIYAEIGDLTQAKYWVTRSTSLGYSAPLLERQEFDELLRYKEHQFEELKKKLPAHVLSSNVPIHTLHERYVKRLSPAWRALDDLDHNFDDLMRDIRQTLDHLLEKDEEEIDDIRFLRQCNPKQSLILNEYRRRLVSGEVGSETESRVIERAGFIRSFPAVGGHHKQRGPTPEEIPSLMLSLSIKFEDLDPTIDQVHSGRVINLTIMEEYIEGMEDPIQTVVKDDNDDFNLIHFYNFDRSDLSIAKKMSHGSRIRLMNPYLSLSEYGKPVVIRVDDPSNVLFLSSGEENPICRYCWEPNPRPRCTKCKVAKYCDKECQTLDWKGLGHKDLCKVLRKGQKTSAGK